MRRRAALALAGCKAAKRHALLATPDGNVFDEDRWYGADGWQSAAFACSYAADTRVLLGEDNDDDSDFDHFALAGGFVGGPPTVWIHDGTGLRRVAASAGIALRSLTLAASTISWIDGGVPHTAPIH